MSDKLLPCATCGILPVTALGETWCINHSLARAKTENWNSAYAWRLVKELAGALKYVHPKGSPAERKRIAALAKVPEELR